MSKRLKKRRTRVQSALCREAAPPTAPLLSKSISKQLFDQLVKSLAATNKLTSYNIPALGTKHASRCQESAGILICHTAVEPSPCAESHRRSQTLMIAAVPDTSDWVVAEGFD